MKIAAIDSSGLVASVAVIEDDNLIAEYTTNYKKTHSQTLLPMLDEVKQMIDLDLSTLDAIAVSAGPGSFTGLRIGSATAKGLGLALNKPLIGVPTVDALAMNLYGTDQIICPLMDARRSQVYTGIYRFVPVKQSGTEHTACPRDTQDTLEIQYSLDILEPQCVVPVEEIADRLNRLSGDTGVIFLGDGVPVFREKLAKLMCRPYTFAPALCNRQRAAAVAVLAAGYAKEGKMVPAHAYVPEYLRPSQAERERSEARKMAGEQAGDAMMSKGTFSKEKKSLSGESGG